MEVGEQLGSGTEGFLAEKPGVYRHAGKWVEVVFPIAESVTETLSGEEIKLRTGVLTNNPSRLREEPSLSKKKMISIHCGCGLQSLQAAC